MLLLLESFSLIFFSRSTVCSQYILWMDISYLQTFAHTRLTCCVFFWRCVCVFVCLSIAVCLCKVGMWIILMPSLRFNLKYLPKMTCWFSLFKVFHLVIYANKKLLIFIFCSFMDSFVSGPLRPVITCGTWGLMTSLPVSFRIKSSSVKAGWFGGGDHCGAGRRSVSLFPPNNFFKKQILQKWGRDLHACDFKWWFVVFRINILKTNKKDWSINFSVSLSFHYRIKTHWKLWLFSSQFRFFFSMLRKIHLNFELQIQNCNSEKKIWILTILVLYIAFFYFNKL